VLLNFIRTLSSDEGELHVVYIGKETLDDPTLDLASVELEHLVHYACLLGHQVRLPLVALREVVLQQSMHVHILALWRLRTAVLSFLSLLRSEIVPRVWLVGVAGASNAYVFGADVPNFVDVAHFDDYLIFNFLEGVGIRVNLRISFVVNGKCQEVVLNLPGLQHKFSCAILSVIVCWRLVLSCLV